MIHAALRILNNAFSFMEISSLIYHLGIASYGAVYA